MHVYLENFDESRENRLLKNDKPKNKENYQTINITKSTSTLPLSAKSHSTWHVKRNESQSKKTNNADHYQQTKHEAFKKIP